ncbi:MAG TPA: hypothetical protein VFD50_11295 [Thermoleophilia bacterium]|nr:hypothetical protein [Thermoleophilia bacterium]
MTGAPLMKLEMSDEVRSLVAQRGGRLFVWTKLHGRCCGRITLLETSTEPPGPDGRDFRRIEAEGFDLFIDSGGRRLPDTLVLEARGRSRTVRAYWNDLGWVG